ncbi:MAG: FlgD immunoglobulin-like domain containing protein, partial [Candidatus Limnocylindrales bacterium]
MATPSQSIAVQRVDNFAAGFLAVGARTVFALTFQPAEEIVNSLFSDHDTMEGLFQKRFNPWGNGDTDPYYGWVGWNPTYHDSVRTPGAQLLLDPHPSKSYRRALSGDFTMTTDQWSGSADPSDVTAPEVTSLEGVPSSGTFGPSEAAVPIFTPNGDGLSDTLSIKSTVSEPAYLDFKVRDESGAVVRSFSTWSEAGDSTSTWSGKSDAGAWVPEGRYDIEAKPRDVAGNVGEVATTRVKVLKAMKSPTGAPSFLFARDGDALASTSAMSVTMTSVASLDWKITNTAGDTVRSFMSAQTVSPGLLAQVWDGKDDAGAYVPDGMYWQVLTATTDAGTYSHMLSIRVMPFKVTAPQWSGPAGTKVTFSVISAESLTGYAVIWVYQPGVERYRISPVRASATKFKFTVTFKPGTAGQVAIKMSGKDIAGGKNNQTVNFTLQ